MELGDRVGEQFGPPTKKKLTEWAETIKAFHEALTKLDPPLGPGLPRHQPHRAVFGGEVTIMSDASTSGWGASCGTFLIGGPWTLSDAHQHARANSSLSSSADGCNFSISCCWSTISLPWHTSITKEVHSQSNCQTWL